VSEKTNTLVLRGSAVLWAIWGIFHLFIGAYLLWVLHAEHPVGQLAEIPAVLDFGFMGTPARFATVASLKQHSFNLAWIGVAVTVGSVFVWRRNPLGIFFNAILGGCADLGYFLFVDLSGYADPPGPQMTYICATAIALSLYGFFRQSAPHAYPVHRAQSDP
jgi:hypothetical protein